MVNPMNSDHPSAKKITLSTDFKTSLLFVIVLVIVSLSAYMYFCFSYEYFTTYQKDAINMLDWIIKMGFGAILGLIGEKGTEGS